MAKSLLIDLVQRPYVYVRTARLHIDLSIHHWWRPAEAFYQSDRLTRQVYHHPSNANKVCHVLDSGNAFGHRGKQDVRQARKHSPWCPLTVTSHQRNLRCGPHELPPHAAHHYITHKARKSHQQRLSLHPPWRTMTAFCCLREPHLPVCKQGLPVCTLLGLS